MKKIVIILRGVPGCSKSTYAEYLKDTLKTESVICCADDYFMFGDKYEFDFAKLGAAHKYCRDLFKMSIDNNIENIIVANTSTKESDVNYYRNIAIENGYRVFVMILENYHNVKDVHNVPEDAKENMKKQLLASIKL